MNHFWCILLAFFILSCGNNSTGPEIKPEPIPEPEPISQPVTGDLVITLPGGVKMAFMWVEPGTLRVETQYRYIPTGEIFYNTIEIPNGYYLGKYELTQQQWEQVMNTVHWPKRLESGYAEPVYPAYNISWGEARDFAAKLTVLQNDGIYRLPTVDEWEYACRAGAITPWWFFGSSPDSLSDYAWWGKNVDSAQIVGTKLPNPWGLYDMYGNLWEWIQNPRGFYPEGQARRIGGSYDTMNTRDLSCGGDQLSYYNLRTPDMGVRILREGPKVSQP